MNKFESQSRQKGVEINIFGFMVNYMKSLPIIIIISILIGIAAGVASKTLSVDKYSSTVSFVVNTLTEGEKAESSAVSAQMNMANTFQYILSGRVLKESVVEKCPDKVSYETVNSSISVRVIPSTNVVELKVMTNSPKTSFNIAKTVVDVYGDIVAEIYPNAKLILCDKPVYAEKPEADHSPLIVSVASIIAAIILGTCISFIAFIAKDTVKSASDLRDKTGILVMGSIARINNSKGSDKKNYLVTDKKTGFSFIETYKSIRTKLENNSAKTGNKVYLVTSASENEGKTTVAINIAISLAQNGKSVLLVDADLRKPSVNKYLSLNVTNSGLADVILGKVTLDKAIKFVNNAGVYILADSDEVSNPSELLSMDVTGQIIKSVRSQFDYIIIDTAPASVVTDASVISSFSDAAILVVRENYSPYSKIQMTVDDIDSNGAEIIGCVYNMDTANAAAGHRRYGRYGRYSRYGCYGRYGRYGYSNDVPYGTYGSGKNN